MPKKLTPKAYADDGVPVWCAHDEIGGLDDAPENPKNPNKHPDAQVKMLAHIMKKQGWRNSITRSKRSGMITKGACRKKAAKLNGWTKGPIDWQEYPSEAKEMEDLMADNRIAELAEPDIDLVKELLQTVEGIDATLTGYDTDELFSTGEPVPEDPGARLDRADELKLKWDTSKGQVWEIPSAHAKGNHRLVIGDCTLQGPWDALCAANEKAELIFTDPPYNVDYTGQQKSQMKIKNDHMKDAEFEQFLKLAFQKMAEHTRPGASFYVCHSDQKALEFRTAISTTGWVIKQCIVWLKQHFVMGRQDYHWKHEPILYGWTPEDEPHKIYQPMHETMLYGWKEGDRHLFFGGRCQTTVWDIDRPMKNTEHPTMKPVELIEIAINNNSEKGNLVLDPFLGSGSTIVACERTGRICYGMELDPAYGAVILQRCQDMGLEPLLVSSAGPACQT